ncbi:MAG: nucleotide exchange factor GrpE [Deltaproteobacteria bacterium]|nr:nucleotide exchange factor GrpE [Deltaproteobacteria bacterium]
MDNGEHAGQTEETLDTPEGTPTAEETTLIGSEEALGDEVPSAEEAPNNAPFDWEGEAHKYHDLYLRTLAEMENLKRRSKKENEETRRYATEGLLRGLVPVLDNLNLALNYADESIPAAKNLAEGVRMTLKGFMVSLLERGFKEVEVSRGQTFDPNVHEALGQEPDPELADMTVSREVAKGYFLGDRLLRPAKVMVVKNPAA